MRPDDLMIGNWVECIDSTHKKKVYAQIDAIEEGQTCILVKLDNRNWFLDISFIKPIPLTQEILEKNGFIRHGTNYLLMGDNFSLDNPSYANDYKDNYWVRLSRAKVRVEYVHELQRLLKCANITKEIEL